MINLLPPKTALNLLITMIGKKINQKIDTCDIILNNKDEKLTFIINGDVYEESQDELKTIFLELGKAKIPENTQIDFLKIKTKKGSDYFLEIYTSNTQDENDKKLLKEKL